MARGDGFRSSLAGWVAALTPRGRARTPTTSSTPTGREGNAPPAKPGNDSTALWGNNDLSRFDSTFTPGQLFGPARPMVPQERENVRLRNYPVGYNLSYTPRSYEPVTFAELRAMARETVMVRLAIETRKDQIEKLDWNIKPKDESSAGSDVIKRADKMQKWWEKPDRVQNFAGWLREAIEEVLVIDAPAFEVRRTRGGDIIGLDIIDGATIKVLIDETGRWPQPPAPGYGPVIHGRPWRRCSRDQLV
jgi:hypothetical protein